MIRTLPAPHRRATTGPQSADGPAVDARPGRPGLPAVLAAMFLLPWLVWGSALAQAHHLIGWRAPQGIALWVLTPSLLVVLAATGGRAAVTELARRLVRRGVPLRVWAVALAAPIAIGAATVAARAVMGHAAALGTTMPLPAAVTYLVYGTGLFLLTEEAGWRGLVLPRLQRRLTPLAASLVLGLIWGCWHLPLLQVPGETDHGLPLAAFGLLIVATSVLITAVVNAARGSVVIAALFHASFDAAYSYTGVVGPDHARIWTAAALTCVLAAIVAVVTRGRLGQGPSAPHARLPRRRVTDLADHPARQHATDRAPGTQLLVVRDFFAEYAR